MSAATYCAMRISVLDLGCHRANRIDCSVEFEHTKLHLTQWFLAKYMLTKSKNAVSTMELMRDVGVRYKAAWRLKHKFFG